MNKHTIWGIAFRPFFLVGSLIGALLVSYWAVSFFRGELPDGYFDPIYWHAHEMIYGFALAIVAGFLLTASANWTRTKPLSGNKLIYLFFLWFAGRIAFTLSLWDLPISPWIYFIVDILFIPGLILSLAAPLINARNHKNSQFLLVLGLLWVGNLLMHLAALGVISFDYAGKGLYLGMHLILFIIIIIGGRIVPFFTMNTIPKIGIKKFPWLDYSALISVGAYILIDFFEKEAVLTGWVALVAAVLNLARLGTWKPWKTLHHPLLWILHIGYLWIVTGFLLVFLSDVFELLPRSVAIHAFTAGAMSTFILGMMSRVSLGHTGRKLELASGFILSYVFITLSGIIRVGSGFFFDYYGEGILLSGIFWGLSFLMFIIYYYVILITPRPDGRAG